MTREPRPDDRLNAEPDDVNIRQGVPSGDWSHQELYDRAKHENKLIGRHEDCAAHYWYLGKALLLVRRDSDHGRWKRWCAAHHIERSRWARASVLARAFASPDEFAGMSLKAASALARALLGLKPRQTALEARHRRRLHNLQKVLRKSLDELSGAAALSVRDELLFAVDEAARLLRELHHAYVAAQGPQYAAVRGSSVPA